ncbi:MAG: NAD(P)H-binding protein [Neisseria sp.]|uniref:NAD(P)-dependent oxidoreductase n=1 Tax=Neisseria sp. TaxID=192066 RepID=UPI0026DCB241|nr:NAD(P)H-binding protein [Neisseria sp.]MDO4249496.1 NAD(P)H-binding protein [Neisseria sp.]
MKFAVIGATGYVGSAVVKELASRGHDITAFARNSAKVLPAANVNAVAADINAPDFAEKLRGFDGVVSAFNPGWATENQAETAAQGAAAIAAAAEAAEVPYLLVVGGAGSLYIAPGVQLVDTPEFPQEIFPAANAMRNHLADLQQNSRLNWAFISPPADFYEGSPHQAGGGYRTGKDDVLTSETGLAGIHVDDLAKAIADDVETKAHLRQRFTVASA